MARDKLKAKEEILLCKGLVFNRADFEDERFSWDGRFATLGDMTLELGMGAGKYLTTMASQFPGHRFLGLEIKEERVFSAVKKIRKLGLTNVRLLHAPVELLDTYHLDDGVSLILLQFPDPWPKKRHYKRRLTGPDYLRLYRGVLATEGRLVFRTDHRDYFEWTVDQFEREGWTILKADWNEVAGPELMTEFETKFRKRGLPIYSLTAVPPAGDLIEHRSA